MPQPEGILHLIETADFKNGMSIIWDGDIYVIAEFQHVKPGKGPAFVRTVLKNVRTGATIERKFRAGEKMEQAILDRRKMQYLYSTGDDYVFMDMQDFEQLSIPGETIGDGIKYLKESIEVTVLMHDSDIIGVEIPFFVDLEVVETDPGVRGDTVSGSGKPATLETGAMVQVPFFVNVGDVIKVDTRTDTYIERVNK